MNISQPVANFKQKSFCHCFASISTAAPNAAYRRFKANDASRVWGNTAADIATVSVYNPPPAKRVVREFSRLSSARSDVASAGRKGCDVPVVNHGGFGSAFVFRGSA